MQGAPVQYLVEELGSHMVQPKNKNKIKTKKPHNFFTLKLEKQNVEIDIKILFFTATKNKILRSFLLSGTIPGGEKKVIYRNYGDPLTQTQIHGDSLPPKKSQVFLLLTD